MILCEETFSLLKVGDRLRFLNPEEDYGYKSQEDEWREVTVQVIAKDFFFTFVYKCKETDSYEEWSVNFAPYDTWEWMQDPRGDVRWFDIWNDRRKDGTTSEISKAD